MATELLDHFLDIVDAGAKPGESHIEFRARLKGHRTQLETVFTKTVDLQAQALGASASSVKAFIAPYPLQITAIRASKHGTVSGTGTATLVNRDASANTDKNPLSAANVNIVGLATANEGESQTLSATAANLQMDAGDCLQATFATAGGSQCDGATISVTYKAIEAVD